MLIREMTDLTDKPEKEGTRCSRGTHVPLNMQEFSAVQVFFLSISNASEENDRGFKLESA